MHSLRSKFVYGSVKNVHFLFTNKLSIFSGQILTTKLVNMGQSRLQTFDELVTGEMAPEATFTVWHVDERGDIVSSSMTVIVHSHERARVRADDLS